MMPPTPTLRRILIGMLLLAFGLRAAYALSQDLDAPYTTRGGDTAWYLQNGYTLVTNDDPTGRHDISRLPVGPVYLLFIGVWQALLSKAAAIAVIRLLQAAMGSVVCFFAYRLARALANDEIAGLLAAGALAFAPALIVESAQILTESLFLCLLMGALWLYVDFVLPRDTAQSAATRWPVITLGLTLGLAALTRAVLLLYPLGLAGHLLLVRGRRRGSRQVALLLVVYACTVGSWTAYSLARWDHFVIGAEGYASFIFVGATGWNDPQGVDANLAEETGSDEQASNTDTLEAAGSIIRRDPVGYVRRRVSELADAYLQPHNTETFSGPSLKTRAHNWLRDDRSVSGLRRLLQIDGFWPKLSLYVFHFVGLLLGLLGMWHTRRAWRVHLPLSGLVLYFTLIHLVLLALPRYLFPLYPVWWIFAAVMVRHYVAQIMLRRAGGAAGPVSASRRPTGRV